MIFEWYFENSWNFKFVTVTEPLIIFRSHHTPQILYDVTIREPIIILRSHHTLHTSPNPYLVPTAWGGYFHILFKSACLQIATVIFRIIICMIYLPYLTITYQTHLASTRSSPRDGVSVFYSGSQIGDCHGPCYYLYDLLRVSSP